MSNPFDSAEAPALVLENAEKQYSLWPSFLPLPQGWKTAFGPAPRGDCLAFVEDAWVDLRPASLRNAA